jgi:hypothetical protein
VGTSALTAGRIGKPAERIDASPGELQLPDFFSCNVLPQGGFVATACGDGKPPCAVRRPVIEDQKSGVSACGIGWRFWLKVSPLFSAHTVSAIDQLTLNHERFMVIGPL